MNTCHVQGKWRGVEYSLKKEGLSILWPYFEPPLIWELEIKEGGSTFRGIIFLTPSPIAK